MPKTARRCRTTDRGPPEARRAPVYTVGQIGPKRKMRPDGTLLCEDVPLARTGVQMYAPGETPIKAPTRPGAAAVCYVTRDAAALFAPESLGSVVGAAVTNDHPPSDVTPENWNALARGFVLDAWQGVGEYQDLMFGDIVIADKGLIHKVNTNQIREVSLGYDSTYEQTGDGEGRQSNIVINHLALVERGRCGPRCAIGDHATMEEENMPRPSQHAAGGQRPRARLDDVRDALDELEENDDGVHVHVYTNDGAAPVVKDPPVAAATRDSEAHARLDDIEEGMTEMRGMLRELLDSSVAPLAAAAAAAASHAAVGDSAALSTSFQQFVAQAEILVPGFRVPTFDSALPRAKTVDNMCAGRRQVLGMLTATTEGAALMAQVCDEGFDAQKSDCASVTTVFKAAATIKGAANNRASTGDRMGLPAAAAQSFVAIGGCIPQSADTINENNKKFWAGQ